MMNKILSLAMDVNRKKLLLTSPLIFFVVLTIANTPAQAQYWDRWYYQTYQQRYYSGYSHGYNDGQNNYTYDCSGHTILACTVVDMAKVMPTDKHNISRRKRINSSNSSNNPNLRHLVALVIVIRL
jgi:hypothetical protein